MGGFAPLSPSLRSLPGRRCRVRYAFLYCPSSLGARAVPERRAPLSSRPPPRASDRPSRFVPPSPARPPRAPRGGRVPDPAPPGRSRRSRSRRPPPLGPASGARGRPCRHGYRRSRAGQRRDRHDGGGQHRARAVPAPRAPPRQLLRGPHRAPHPVDPRGAAPPEAAADPPRFERAPVHGPRDDRGRGHPHAHRDPLEAYCSPA